MNFTCFIGISSPHRLPESVSISCSRTFSILNSIKLRAIASHVMQGRTHSHGTHPKSSGTIPCMTLHELTVRDPSICGGQPVFRGTRVTLRSVLASLADGDSIE